MTDHETMSLAELLACRCAECRRCTCEDKHDLDAILILTRKGLSGWLKVSESAIRKAEAEHRIERRPDGCYSLWDVIADWYRNTRPNRLHPEIRSRYLRNLA